MLLIFDQEPENVAASTSKVNTIESLPANKKSDCVCPLIRIDMPLLAPGQKIALGILFIIFSLQSFSQPQSKIS